MPPFDPVILAAAAIAALLLIAAVWAAVRASRGAAGNQAHLTALAEAMTRLQENQAALGGRLTQLGEGLATAQARAGEQLQAQERAVSKTLDERLSDVSRRVGENLSQLQQRLAVIDSAQKNIAELSAEVVGLQDLLSNKQVRGAIGQTQMENLVRDMLPASAYEFQFTLGNGKRADCVIKLPNPPGLIAIDSKSPLDAYTRMRDAKDERERTAAEQSFKGDVLKHIKDIAEKYIVPGETADSAIMFVPAESVFAELHERFPDVVDQGFRRRVYVVSPTTLMATLNTVRAILKDARMREQAHVIQREVGEMIRDVERLDKRVGNLGTHFDQARRDIDEIQVSTRKIVKRGENIEAIPLEERAAEADSLPMAREEPPARRELLQ